MEINFGNSVFINNVSSYLPNKPVDNEHMEEYLGLIGKKPSRVKNIILRQNGIKTRYYALDKNQRMTHTNAQMSANAIRNLESDTFNLKQLEFLSCGTSIPDQTLPSHASMVHGEIGGRAMEIVSPSGICASGAHAIKTGYLSVLCGNSRNAVCSGSEASASAFTSQNYSEEYESRKNVEANPMIAFEKDFLRFMLSDGAGAILLGNSPQGRHPLRIEWIESISYANEEAACMYMGGEKCEDGSLRGWRQFSQKERMEKSVYAVRQDIRLLEKRGVSLWTRHLVDAFGKHGLSTDAIDYFLPHMSSMYFKDKIDLSMRTKGIGIEADKWFYNLPEVGNVGSASIYLALDELFHSGRLRAGEKILLAVPESGRFSYVSALLTVV